MLPRLTLIGSFCCKQEFDKSNSDDNASCFDFLFTNPELSQKMSRYRAKFFSIKTQARHFHKKKHAN